MRPIVLGTRGSALALWQARHVAGELRRLLPGLEIEERIIRTEGDIQQVEPLGMGDRGVFVRRIEEALLSGRIDLAVHSLKDLPTAQPEGLVVAAVPPRHDPRDALLTRDGTLFEQLPAGTVIGTGSFRRRTQLLHARPELSTTPLRGNVDTRARRVAEGSLDAVVLALAGLQRLGVDSVPYRPIDIETCLPAVGQGALAVECRQDDDDVRTLLARFEDVPSRAAVNAERAFLRRLGGGCLAPATAFATVDGPSLLVRAAVGDRDGKTLLRDREEGKARDAAAVGLRLAERMIDAGAEALLDEARAAAERDVAG